MILDLIRHGSTGRNGYMDGRTDPEMSVSGLSEFERAVRGNTWGLLVTSPLRRAQAAAAHTAARHSVTLEVDPRWAEIDFGVWDGRLRSQIEADVGGAQSIAEFFADPAAHPPPEGESWSTFCARVVQALVALVARNLSSPTLVVTHAGPMRVALAALCAIPFEHLWAIRIGYATRVRIQAGIDPMGRLWGEIIEIRQP
jgi:alpha-ribazole phosphatase